MPVQFKKWSHDSRVHLASSIAALVRDNVGVDGDHGEGALEAVQREQQNTRDALGRLVEALHNRGVLDDADLETIVEVCDVRSGIHEADTT